MEKDKNMLWNADSIEKIDRRVKRRERLSVALGSLAGTDRLREHLPEAAPFIQGFCITA
jgi:hypothetical protein